VRGVSAAYSLAGELREPSAMRRTNVESIEQLLIAAQESNVNTFIHLSSAGVIGPRHAGVITEESPCRPVTEYERTKLAGEQVVLELGASSAVNVIVVRPTTVFGEWAGVIHGSFLQWLKAVQQGRFFFMGNRAIANYVYAGDVAEVMKRLGDISRVPSRVWFVADPAPMREFVRAMAKALGVKAPRFTVPLPAAYAAGAAMELAQRLLRPKVPLTRQRVRALSSTALYSGAKLESLGVSLPIGYEAGLMRTVDWYRSNGQL
jgi:dihydroflavonol-4-reductase